MTINWQARMTSRAMVSALPGLASFDGPAPSVPGLAEEVDEVDMGVSTE